MKSSKLLMSVMVVVLILSFTISTVGAQSQVPPVGELDEDGDLIINVLPPMNLEEAAGLPDLELFAKPGSGGLQPDIEPAVPVPGPPVPLYPIGEVIYSKYPRFSFMEIVGATKYKVEVYNTIPEPDELVYTIKGTGGDCSCGCNLYPTLPLKPWDINNVSGFYAWRVSSKVEGSWWGWSDFSYFTILKNGFNTTFDTPTKAWYPVTGTWVQTSTGYAKTQGELGMLSSAIEKHMFTKDFVYELKMKRKTSNSSNFIYFQAYPYPLGEMNLWDDGYYFFYRNNGEWGVRRMQNGGVTILADGITTHIKPYDWNKITIKREQVLTKMWVNNHYIGSFDDTSFTYGYVGFGMMKNIAEKDPLLVDWVRLEYTTEDPYPYLLP